MAAKHPLDSVAQHFFGKRAHALEPEEIHVLEQMKEHRPVSRDAADASDDVATFGDRLADKVAAVGGSWAFIITFSVILLGWMLLNSDVLEHFGLVFDPYPYIFLNLMLSTLAAIQAPVIMMSQNRQSAKDRIAASLDYEVNLRTEIEIMRLHDKIDSLIVERLDRVVAQLERRATQE
ncbi:DUF1003 domain-containing protein [Pseudomonas sp. NPDC007930]|uniref:DUF1003 domain-containing protein n=1 Tax=Pseudomonas sp. NPDC007930 TaxID=3364417 RepID=UPI0036E78265